MANEELPQRAHLEPLHSICGVCVRVKDTEKERECKKEQEGRRVVGNIYFESVQ